MKTIRLQIGRDTVACRQSRGRGPAVVLLHGNSCSSLVFDRQLHGPPGEELALTAIDLPGHGASADAADPATGYSLPGYARILVHVVEQLGLHQAVFAGWSLGGHIALEAVAALPRAAGFMLIATPPVGYPPDFASALHPHPDAALLFQAEWTESQAATFSRLAFGAAPTTPEIERDIRRTDGRARGHLAANVGQGNYRDELETVRNLPQPLAVVLGEKDPLMNRAYFDTVPMPTRWRGRVQIVPHAEHAPHWQNAPAFNQVLLAFAQDCSPGNPPRALA